MDDGFKVQFFSRYHRESFGEVEPHLVAKNAQGSCSRTVPFLVPVFQYMLQKVVVLFHAVCSVISVISNQYNDEKARYLDCARYDKKSIHRNYFNKCFLETKRQKTYEEFINCEGVKGERLS